MHCNFISDDILKNIIKDLRSLEISKALRCKRSGFKKTLMSFFPSANAVEIAKRNRETYNCNHKENLPGELALMEQSPLGNDPVINAAHLNAAQAFAFFGTMFNRVSLDDKGMTIKSCAHYGEKYNNAFWNGSEMVYGDGDGKFFREMTRSLDVCTHEMAHSVTQFTNNLMYYGQSGALNESFSDIMGIACKHWVNKQFEPENANWLIGDDIVGSEFPGKAIRSFKDEKAYEGDMQPKRFDKLVWTFQDNGGVHINSGAHNHFFYQLCLAMSKPSYDQPLQIVYRAHTKYTNSWTDFKGYAKAEYKAANELYGAGAAMLVKDIYASLGLKW